MVNRSVMRLMKVKPSDATSSQTSDQIGVSVKMNSRGQVKTSRHSPRPKPPLPPMKTKKQEATRRSSRQLNIKERQVIRVTAKYTVQVYVPC